MDMDNNKVKQPLILPTLRGKMGDWFYYVTLMPFQEVAQRVISHAGEVLNTTRLRENEMTHKTQELVDYLKKQEQRFFNSLILGIYKGSPTWQEIDVIENQNFYEDFPKESLDDLSKTFGILTLHGDENIFVIDGLLETQAIKEAIKQDNRLANEEVTVIFVAHQETPEGRMRTNRLISHLNQYAQLQTVNG
jgi:DNA sulfur modification protein DndB